MRGQIDVSAVGPRLDPTEVAREADQLAHGHLIGAELGGRRADVGLPEFERRCELNEIFAANVIDLPAEARKLFEAQAIRSLMTVPIFVEGIWWGFVGFDDRVAERDWTPAETDALRAFIAVDGRLSEGDCHYPDIDLLWDQSNDRYTHKDGTPY